jgi:hypothetical protein
MAGTVSARHGCSPGVPRAAVPVTATGPFGTEREVRELAAVQAIYRAFGADLGAGRMAPHNPRLLGEACAAAGVGLGAYDARILDWLAGSGPETCAVIAELISRAHDAGKASRPAGDAR